MTDEQAGEMVLDAYSGTWHKKGERPPRYGIKCNVKAVHRFLRRGALCWIVHSSGDGGARFGVRGLSRGGHVVEAYVDSRDLMNFRAVSIPPDGVGSWARPFGRTREEAEAIAAGLNERFGTQPVRPHAAAFDRSAP